MLESRGARTEIARTRIDMGCDAKRGYCMKTDAQGAGSSGDMRKRKRGVRMMTLDCVVVRGSAEVADRWTLTTEIMQECLHECSSM